MAAAGTLSAIHRLQVVWARAGGDDVGVTTHDFRQLDTVFPDAGGTGDTHNYATLEADFGTFWAAIKTLYPPATYPQEYRWYRNDLPVPEWGEPSRVATPLVVAGTSTDGRMQAPQVACSVTERVDSRRHWGRFYLPTVVPASTQVTANGRLTSATVTTIANAAQALYNAWNLRGLRCVVLGSVKTSYSLALLPATSWLGDEFSKYVGKQLTEPRILVAYDVKQVRVDDVQDIIRRRRPAPATIRLDRNVT